MTAPVARTWVDLDALSTTNLNGGVRDPVAFLFSPPRAELRATSAQTFTTAVAAAVAFNAEDVDTDVDGVGGHDNVTNNTRYTARYTGLYLVSGGVGFLANATGDRYAWWRVNGTDVNGSLGFLPGDASAVCVVQARTKKIFLNAGDYVELVGFQDSGGNLSSAVTTRDQPSMNVLWVSN